MTLSNVYGNLLLPFVEKYMAVKNEKGRAAVVKNAADVVLENSNMMEDQGTDLPKDLRKVCTFLSLSLAVSL